MTTVHYRLSTIRPAILQVFKPGIERKNWAMVHSVKFGKKKVKMNMATGSTELLRSVPYGNFELSRLTTKENW